MVEREVIRRIIIEGQEFVNEISLTERPFFFEQKGNYVFVGIRQAGKSYLLYQRIQQLLREEHNINEIVYINFDDERLRQMTADDLDLIQHIIACLICVLYFSLMRYRISKVGNTLPDAWQTRSITFTSPVAMPKC